MCVYIVKLPPDSLPPWRQFGWKQCDLRPLEVLYTCHFKKLIPKVQTRTTTYSPYSTYPNTRTTPYSTFSQGSGTTTSASMGSSKDAVADTY